MIEFAPHSTAKIDQTWPADWLEEIHHCPYCNSPERTVAHVDVQDWSFYSAPGKWTYWSCSGCKSLYLSPRPTPSTVGHAYASYYTHHAGEPSSLLKRFVDRLRNEYWSHRLRANLRPRLHVPGALKWLISPLGSRLLEPFEIVELVNLPKGRLMDVGCGNGQLLGVAEGLGWVATGLEVDPVAVCAARLRGLDVIEGSYARLAEYHHEFDCIICFHVLEHVHDPRDMIMKLAHALKPGGTLLLAAPNATSNLRKHFGNDWRGLEAPRHLSIPSIRQLETMLRDIGFGVRHRSITRPWTALESSRIRRRDVRITAYDKAVASELASSAVPRSEDEYDFSEFVCVRESDAH